jgi:transcriptional regulator with XRE-family HTH domain
MMNTKGSFSVKLGNKLRSIRSEKNITIEELAIQSDMTYSQVSRIELGKINTTVYTLYRLANTLMVHPKEILPEDLH